MINKIKNIQNMMRELVIASVIKCNERKKSNNTYNAGIAHAYTSTLSLLYDQARLFNIPLDCLSLHIINPERDSFSADMISFDKSIPIPMLREENYDNVLGWLSDNKLLLKELYDDHLLDSAKDKFDESVIIGFRE